MISADLIEFLRTQFRLDWHGIHGAPHWARVRYNGFQLAMLNGANIEVVELFAFLHDACRIADSGDPNHGNRAAELADTLNGKYFSLDSTALLLLKKACSEHSEGYVRGDITVRTCWDADRLDLGRIGIRPEPQKLCTVEAQSPAVIAAAYRRSLRVGHGNRLND